jgi:hypothetical protein
VLYGHKTRPARVWFILRLFKEAVSTECIILFSKYNFPSKANTKHRSTTAAHYINIHSVSYRTSCSSFLFFSRSSVGFIARRKSREFYASCDLYSNCQIKKIRTHAHLVLDINSFVDGIHLCKQRKVPLRMSRNK